MWYKEWFMCFEFVWGRSITNIATMLAAFGIHYSNIVRRMINFMLRPVLNAQKH